jgi:predicted SnoaL-like aldol condensation-catalyzing enzyme
MSTKIEENKRLVLRFFKAIENKKLEEFDIIIAIDYHDHLPGQKLGRDVLKEYFSGLHEVFKDLKFPIHAIIAEGDKVAVYNSIQGVHKSDYGTFKAKGNPIDAKAFQLYRISNGQLVEHWEVADFMTLVQQIQA